MTPVLVFVALAASTSTDSVKMCFGSCARIATHDQSQPWWEHVINQKPTAFTWLGDAIYADKLSLPHVYRLLNHGGHTPTQEPKYAETYRAQKEHPEYKRLRDAMPVYGMWDDHDYGSNDGDKTWIHKNNALQEFLNFLDVPQDSPRRKRNGVYSSERIPFGDSHILLLLLDVRYNKDPWSTKPHGDFLGEEQWAWLEKELTDSDAQLILLGSGIQMLWNDWGQIGGEHWNNFPVAKHQLLTLLSGRRVVFVSGDVHMVEVRYVDPWHALEVTTSGLSHSWSTGALNRVTELVGGLEFPNYIAHLLMLSGQKLLPHPFQVANSLTRNFACLDIGPQGVTVEAWSIHGDPLFTRHYANEALEFKYNRTYPLNTYHGGFTNVSDYWLCALATIVLLSSPVVVAVGVTVLLWRVRAWMRNRKKKQA